MANEKQIKARLQQKHDIEANWNLATNFVPKQGELIVYDKDENYSYERMKIGDGEKTVDALPFIDAQTFDENGVIKQNALPEGYPYATSGEVLPMTSVSFDPDSGQGMIVDKFSLIKDEEYEVIWNGANYTCTGVEYSLDGIPLICVGDLAVFEGIEPTDYPFLVARIADDATAEVVGAYGMVISHEGLTDVNLSINGTIVYQIDKKFVPTPDVVTNIVNGDSFGSLRSRGAAPNDDEYQIGQFATALGYMTKASGYCSHAEGYYTIASGDCSHVEGDETTASGYYSHAENSNNTASGDCSHAEGFNTTASGQDSHAEGVRTTASGSCSHAEGYHTVASGSYQHVQGKYNIEDTAGSYAHIVGNGSNGKPSNAHTLDWNGNAWFAGDVYVGSTSGTNEDDGSKKLATEEYVNLNRGVGALVAGRVFSIDGVSVTAEEGAEIFNYSGNIATGINSHAEGSQTIASGSGDHAEGVLTTASGTLGSHAEGMHTTASGESSHAEGANTAASGIESHAEGARTTASGRYSHAEGWQSFASGDSSHAEGFNTTASGEYSHAEGWYTVASGECQHVQGKYNIEDNANKYVHIVGNGNQFPGAVVERSNAHTLDWNGNAWFAGDVYVGSTSGKDKDAGSKKLVTEADLASLTASDVGALPDTTVIPSIAGLATETYVNNIASTKVDKVDGKGLSTNDYTTTEKNKLSGIASGAEVNQNAFSNIVVGSTTIAADSKTDSLTIAAGTGISVTGDATNDKVTITNSGVRAISTGSSNGTISVNTNGTAVDVAIKGLGSAAYTASTAYDAAGTAKAKADAALASAKTYADGIKNDLLNGAGSAYDTLKELGDLIDTNVDAIDALETVAAGKADKTHTHTIANVSGLQSALDGKAASSHGTHVSYSTTAPVIDGTASAGSASTVARSDHKHPTDTSRASKTEFDTHTGNTTVHITSAERTNWNAAKTHANSAHAPSNAEKNQNAFSNVKVGSTTIVADSTTDTLTLVAGTNVTITPDATNDKITISATDTNTTYSAGAGISLSGTTFSNSGVRSISTGSSNGTISVNTNGTAVDVAIKGLGSAAYTASTAYDAAGTAQTKADAALKSAKTYADGIKNDLLGKADKTHTHVIADVSDLQSSLDAKVPTSRTINGKALTTNISLTASDVGALPDTTVIPSIDGLATKEYVNTKIQNALDAIGVAEDGEY